MDEGTTFGIKYIRLHLSRVVYLFVYWLCFLLNVIIINFNLVRLVHIGNLTKL